MIKWGIIMGKKILVTGGAGFIGGNYLHYHINKYPEDTVVNLDLLTYAGNLRTCEPVYLNDNYVFVEGCITDRLFINQLFKEEQFDVVINFAAESHVDRSVTSPEIFTNTNIIGTQVLMDAARKYKVKRFHQVSTDEVYGDLPLDAPEELFTEDTPLNPSSPYSASKAAADMLALAYFRTYDFPVTISRCSNNYGPYQYPEKLIPLMVLKAIKNQKLPIYGDGENVRDWLHVYDHCVAIDLIVRKGTVGEVYNVGGNNEKTNHQVVTSILSELNKSESLIEYVKDRPGHDLRYAIDATKIKEELAWKPTYNFTKGLKQTINWYLENEKWWQEIIEKGRKLT